MTIGEKIQEARNKAGVSQRELAARVNAQGAAISQWENDKRTPKTEIMIKIADALGIGIAELLVLPPQCDRERINKMTEAVRKAGEQLESWKREKAPAENIAEAEKVLRATTDVLDEAIVYARLEHQRDLAQKKAQAVSLPEQEDIPAFPASSHEDALELQEKMQETVQSLIWQTVHSAEDGEALAKLIAAYKKLNGAGRMELIKRAEEMTYVPAYDK